MIRIWTLFLIIFLAIPAGASAKEQGQAPLPVTEDTPEYTITFSQLEQTIPIGAPQGGAGSAPIGYIHQIRTGTVITLKAKVDGIFPSLSCYNENNEMVETLDLSGQPLTGKPATMKKGQALTYTATEQDEAFAYLSLNVKAGENALSYYFVVTDGSKEQKVIVVEKRIITASPASAKVRINGREQAFAAYTIGGNNYFKLRDLASALADTQKRFQVEYNGATGEISLTTGTTYTPVGGELAPFAKKEKQTGIATPSTLYLDKKPLTLVAYLIQGNNYFKLRDLGEAMDFQVEWDGAARTISIDTSKPYSQ